MLSPENEKKAKKQGGIEMFAKLKELLKEKHGEISFEEKNGALMSFFKGDEDYKTKWEIVNDEYKEESPFGDIRIWVETPFGLMQKIEYRHELPEEWVKQIDNLEGSEFWILSSSFGDAQELMEAEWNLRNNTPKQVYYHDAKRYSGENSTIDVIHTTKKEDVKFWIKRKLNESESSQAFAVQSDSTKEPITFK